ncbi:hypothetical protein [Iodidimonas sp. SYSU 1G8]|uniref:hypothetical protein n=1 Tax=Iodidimonas sp. SYSU 1G8 TaxID=3133967 RepID=UPI0031FE83A2
MRPLAAIALVAIAVMLGPRDSQTLAADNACADAAEAALRPCLLDRIEGLLGHPEIRVRDPADASAAWYRLAVLASEAGDVARVSRIVPRIGDPRKRRSGLAVLAATQARAGDAHAAVSILNRLLGDSDAHARLPAMPDGDIITVLVALRDPSQTRRYFQILPVAARPEALVALTEALVRGGALDEAERLVADQGDAAPARRVQGAWPLVAMLIDAGRHDTARRLAGLLPQADRDRLEAHIALRIDMDGRTDEARRILGRLLAVPRPDDHVRLAGAIFAVRRGDWNNVRDRFPATIGDEALGELFWMELVDRGRPDLALDLATGVLRIEDRPAALARLARLIVSHPDHRLRARLFDAADQAMDERIKRGAMQAGILRHQPAAIEDLERAHMEAGDLDKARDIARRVEDALKDGAGHMPRIVSAEIVPRVWQPVMEAMIENGERDEVLALASDAPLRAEAARRALARQGLTGDAIELAVRNAPDRLALATYLLDIAGTLPASGKETR